MIMNGLLDLSGNDSATEDIKCVFWYINHPIYQSYSGGI